jgi:hypothetical protein
MRAARRVIWLAVCLSACVVATLADSSCERLKVTLTYTQEKAPRDLSSVVSPVCP